MTRMYVPGIIVALGSLFSSGISAAAPSSVETFLTCLQKGDATTAAQCLTADYRASYPAEALRATWASLAKEIGPANGFVLGPSPSAEAGEQSARLRFGTRSVESLFALGAEGKIACWIVDTHLVLTETTNRRDPSELAEHLREVNLEVEGNRLHLRYPIAGPPLAKILLAVPKTEGPGPQSPADSLGMAFHPEGAEAWAKGLTLAGFVTGVLVVPPDAPPGSPGAPPQTGSGAVIGAAHTLRDMKTRIGVDPGPGAVLLLILGDPTPLRSAWQAADAGIDGIVLVCGAPGAWQSAKGDPRLLVLLGATDDSGSAGEALGAWRAALAAVPGSLVKQYEDLRCPPGGAATAPSRALAQDIALWSRGEEVLSASTEAEFGQGVFGIPVPAPFQARQRDFIRRCAKLCADREARPWGREATYSPDSLYIPKDLEECFQELTALLPPKDLAEFKSAPEGQACAEMHMGLGMWMRNNWGLWAGSRLSFYFADLGVFHPDDMSGVILRSFHRHLNGKPLKVEKQVKFYLDYWKKAQDTQGPSSMDGQSGAKLLR